MIASSVIYSFGIQGQVSICEKKGIGNDMSPVPKFVATPLKWKWEKLVALKMP